MSNSKKLKSFQNAHLRELHECYGQENKALFSRFDSFKTARPFDNVMVKFTWSFTPKFEGITMCISNIGPIVLLRNID